MVQALQGLALLLVLQAAGELAAHSWALPLPGPVVGLAMLLGVLGWAPLRAPVAAAAEVLLGHLSLLFVPVGVGVITHLSVVAQYGWALLVAMLVSTWLGLAVTGVLLQRWLPPEAGPARGNEVGADEGAEPSAPREERT